jgi:hypothetical protein
MLDRSKYTGARFRLICPSVYRARRGAVELGQLIDGESREIAQLDELVEVRCDAL